MTQTLQPDKSAYSPIFERPEGGPEASESTNTEKDDPISYWAVNHTWPDNFAEPRAMSSSNNTNKRRRTSDCYKRQGWKIPELCSESQKYRCPGAIHPFKNYIFTQVLDTNEFKGMEFVSSDSKTTCKELQTMTCETISPSIYSMSKTLKVVELGGKIISLYIKDGGDQFEHLIDEVDTV